MVNISDFGATGDGVFMNTAAFAQAIAVAKEKKDGVYVPAGIYLTGTINLDGVSLYLGTGAVIKGSSDLDDYPPQDFYHNELGVLRALIVNLHADNVTISGTGTIDLNGKSFYDTSVMDVPDSRIPFNDKQTAECTYPIGTRPGQCIFFYDSKNIRISGITEVDAPCWTFSFNECEYVK